MGAWRCLGCNLRTGDKNYHQECPVLGTDIKWELCNCGSGGHPRRCELHPEVFEEHIKELEGESE